MPWNKITTQGYLSEVTVYSNVKTVAFNHKHAMMLFLYTYKFGPQKIFYSSSDLLQFKPIN